MRNKGEIVHIGTVDDDGQPQNWTFDCRGRNVAALDIDNDGVMRWSGWTAAELREVSERQN